MTKNSKTMKIKSRSELIQSFREYFNNPYVLKDNKKEYLSLEHKETESSSVIPQDDTLLFVNSGMVQFKDNLLNPSISDLNRTFSIQKCIRAGGKHNDLDDVGKDSYHHTFFEMMGNWSFGDYFKRESIQMAFTFLKEIGLREEQMYVTYFCKDIVIKEVLSKYFKGEEIENQLKNYKENTLKDEKIMKELSLFKDLQSDEETKSIWLELIDSDKIIPAGFKDNFWEMGDTGPCGPCTEIHYDRLNKKAKHLVNTDQNDVIEIWNLVFIQFYRKSNNSLELLEKKSVDTGMGLERVLGILNGGTNYDTHLFIDLFNLLNFNNLNVKNDEIVKLRIIADHSRTIAVSLNDEIDFSNTGRGYVLRRIIRRLFRRENNLEKLNEIIKAAGESLEIEIKENQLKKVEEELILFNKTLMKGLKKFEELTKNKNYIKSKEAFDLTTTYGFPLDYLKDCCDEKNIKLDLQKYESLMEEFKLLSVKEKESKINLTQKEILKIENYKKEEFFKETEEFFESEKITGKLKFVKFLNEMFAFDELKELKKIKEIEKYENKQCGLIFDKTNFYSEKGGQIGDTGIIKNNKVEIKINDTQKQQNYVLALTNFDKKLLENEDYQMIYDLEKRKSIRRNHTATHLLNYCLLKEIEKIDSKKETIQAGSLVSDDKLRFDYENLKNFDLKKIEEEVNKLIGENLEVEIILKKKEELENIENLKITKLKTEKYPEKVRIIKIGGLRSAELCGGTHVKNTEEIGKFIIHSDSSVSKGIRRITAFTGEKAEEFLHNFESQFNLCKTLKDLEKISEKTIPLKYKNIYNLKKTEFQKKEALKSKNFFKRASKIIKDLSFNENIELEIMQNEDEFVSEKEFSKQFNRLNGILMQKYENQNISIFIKGVSAENKKVYFILMGEVDQIKNNLIKKFNAKINQSKNCFMGFYSIN